MALAKFCDAMDHLVGGDVIEHEADGFGGIQVVRHLNEMRRGDNEVAAVASNHGEGGDTLAGCKAGDAVAESVYIAHDVVAGSEGKRLLHGIEAVAHEDVRVGDAGGNDLGAHLTRTGHWQVVFDPLENFRPAASSDDHAGVLEGSHRYLTQSNQRQPLYLSSGASNRVLDVLTDKLENAQAQETGKPRLLAVKGVETPCPQRKCCRHMQQVQSPRTEVSGMLLR